MDSDSPSRRSWSRRAALGLGAGFAGSALVAGMVGPKGRTSTLLLGATTNYPTANDTTVERSAGHPYDMWRVFVNDGTFDPAPVVSAVTTAAMCGRRRVMLSTRVRDWDGIAAGRYDDQIRSMVLEAAEAARHARVELWLTNWHEPEDDTADYSSAEQGREAWKAQVSRFARVVRTATPDVRVGAILQGWHEISKSSPWYTTWHLHDAVPQGIDWLGFDPYQNYGMPKTGGGTRTDWVDVPMYANYLADYCGPRGIKWGFAEWGGSEAAHERQPSWMVETVSACARLGGSFCLYFDNTTYLPWTDDNPPPASSTTFAMPTGSKRRAEWIRILSQADSR